MTDRVTASILRAHVPVVSHFVGRLQQGATVVVTADELTVLGHVAGVLNSAMLTAPPPTAMNLHDEIPRGDFERRYFAAVPGVPDVFPFRVPVAPFANGSGIFYLSFSENPSLPGADPWMRKLCVSTVAGDVNGPLCSEGKNVTIHLDANTLTPGALLYANVVITELSAPDGTTGSSGSIVWP